jgi:hypothetical protein
MTEPNSCPTECPNRSRTAISIFGQKIDPIELGLHLLVILCVVVPASRQSVQQDFTPAKALGWIGAMGAGTAIVRLTPTARLNAYATLMGKPTQ